MRTLFYLSLLCPLILSCTIKVQDLTPQNQPSWHDLFENSTYRNQNVWPFRVPEERLFYPNHKDSLLKFNDSLRFGTFLAIKSNPFIADLKPEVVINGTRHPMRKIGNIGIWYRRFLPNELCGVGEFKYYYEIKYSKKRNPFKFNQKQLYSVNEPAHSFYYSPSQEVPRPEDNVTIGVQGMSPNSFSSYYAIRCKEVAFSRVEPMHKKIRIYLYNGQSQEISGGVRIDSVVITGSNEFRLESYPSWINVFPCGQLIETIVAWYPDFDRCYPGNHEIVNSKVTFHCHNIINNVSFNKIGYIFGLYE